MDSTGLKIFGEGKWLHNKHKTTAKRKSWRKLHLGLDLNTGEIVCTDLTKDDDGAPTSDLLMERIGKDIEIIIPPQITAVLSPNTIGFII